MGKEKIAVTGANGFIGSHLCHYLTSEGYQVIPLILKGKISEGGGERRSDVTNSKKIAYDLYDADIVVHLAAISNPSECTSDFENAYRINVEGTRHVVKASKSKRMIFASSAYVYGQPGNNGVCSEDDRLLGKSPYAITKILGETICNNYSWNYQHEINIVRFFNLFGENQPENYIIPTIITQALMKKKVTIRNTQIIRDFLYIDDAVKAILAVIKHGKSGETYNIGSGKGTAIAHIVDYIASRIVDLTIEDLKMSGSEPKSMIANISKIKEIGWKQSTSLNAGLDKMIEFISKNKISTYA